MGAQQTYLDRPITEKQLEDGSSVVSAFGRKVLLRYGTCCMQGWRRSMEDAHICVADFDDDVGGLFAVFDGHGGAGVARFAALTVPSLLKASCAYQRGDFKRAMVEAFLEIDEQLRSPLGRAKVKELEQCYGGKSRQMMMPKGALRRLMAQRQGTGSEAFGAQAVERESEVAAEDASGDCHDKPLTGTRLSCAIRAWNTDASIGGNGEDIADHAEAQDNLKADTAKDEGSSSSSCECADLLEPVQICSDNADEDCELEVDCLQVDDFGDGDVQDGDDEQVVVDPNLLTRDSTPEGQGCTAMVVLVVSSADSGMQLICGNAGDSRAVLSRKGGVALALSDDHKPNLSSESERITNAGGFVWADEAGQARAQGDLNLSRALGDLRYKTNNKLSPDAQIITAYPEVRVVPLVDQDEFLILACDGIWDCYSNQELIDIVRPKLVQSSREGANISGLCGELCDRCLCVSMDYECPSFDWRGCDNMTLIIVQLCNSIEGSTDLSLELAAKRQRFK